MDKRTAIPVLSSLRKQWMRFALLANLFLAAAATFLIVVIARKCLGWWYGWWPACFIIVSCSLFFARRLWQVNEKKIAQWLDLTYPQLEESSTLLLRAPASLNGLENLQYQKTSQALAALPSPLQIGKKSVRPAGLFVLMLTAGLVLYEIPSGGMEKEQAIAQSQKNNSSKPGHILPELAQISLTILPPAYTGKSSRQQQSLNLRAEEGSVVHWQLKTSKAVDRLEFVFNDTVQMALRAADSGHMLWLGNKKIDSTGFYQLRMEESVSARYRIDVIKDQPPVIWVQRPKQYTTIDYGEPAQVLLNTAISDDYGIGKAFISATIASGNGEAVKFKEQQIPLAGFSGGKTRYQLQQVLPLAQLGMQPGDELYFYVETADHYPQQSRSDVFIVHLADTNQLMSLDGMANSLSLKPEYFRSQRQIIIETLQLLKDKDTISTENFKNRSNNLGIDQKLLRLRYGKFLGDEAESGDADTHELEDISNFSNANKIQDAYTDKHDNAEDADFYEPDTKKQLQATLAEMWKAEIPLRTFVPEQALPFEYKALRLLKDMQQKSRAYVAKTNFKTTPLDLKKRLTGELGKIEQPVWQKNIQQERDEQLPVRQALALLEVLKLPGAAPNGSQIILQQANQQLRKNAVRDPQKYLDAVSALEKIMAFFQAGAPIPRQAILEAQKGLQQMLDVPAQLPSAVKATAAQALSAQYFSNLKKTQR